MKNEYCFTYKTGAVYVFPMWDKIGKKLTIKSLRMANEGGIRYQIKRVQILGFLNDLKFNQTEKAMEIYIDENIDKSMPICIKVIVE